MSIRFEPRLGVSVSGIPHPSRPLKDGGASVPEGQDDRSLAVYCLENRHQKAPPRRGGVIPVIGDCSRSKIRRCDTRSDQTVSTRRAFFCVGPGSELPGYDHLVPPGHTA
jgi:hypothetical protein